MEIRKFTCGICQGRNKFFVGTRRSLREHIKKEHFILKSITNVCTPGNKRQAIPKDSTKQSWWITEKFEAIS